MGSYDIQDRKHAIAMRARELRATYPRPPAANVELKQLQKEYETLMNPRHGKK